MKKGIVAGALLLSTLVIQEIFFRAVFPLPELAHFNRRTYSGIPSDGRAMMHDTLVWRSKLDGLVSEGHLNLYGFRDGEWPIGKTPGRQRILVVGTSNVESLGASDDTTLTAAMQDELRRLGKSAEVLNGGILGSRFEEQARVLRDVALLFHPDRIVLVVNAFFAPDHALDAGFLDSRPDDSRLNPWLPRVLALALRALKGERIALRWHLRRSLVFGPVPDPMNPLSDLRRWKHMATVRETDVSPEILSMMKSAEINPWMLDYLYFAEEALTRQADYESNIHGLAEFARREKIPLWIAYHPMAVQISDDYLKGAGRLGRPEYVHSFTGEKYWRQEKQLEAVCRAEKLPYLNLKSALVESERSGRRAYYDYDDHLRPEGYRAEGQALARFVSE